MEVNSNSFKDFILNYIESHKADLIDSYRLLNFGDFSALQCYVVKKMKFSIDKNDVELTFNDSNGFVFRVRKTAPPTSEEAISYNKDYPVLLEDFVENYKFPDEEFYSIHSNFTVYEKLYIDKSDYQKFRSSRRLSLYNYLEWDNFIMQLIRFFFKGYEYSEVHSSEAIQRLVKKIGDIYLGIEYNSKDLQAEIKRGTLCFPELRVVVLDQNSKAGIKGSNSACLLLSKLPHPLMKALTPVESFVASKHVKRTEDGQVEILNPIRERVKGDKIHFSGNESFGSLFKKYMALYTHYVSFFELEYLCLFENALIEFKNSSNEI